jgi:hypothetical protein
MTRKNQSLTVSLSPEDKASLEEIALLYGCTWGEKANISKLLEFIACKKLKVVYGDETPDAQVVLRKKQGQAAIQKIIQGLMELSAIWF